ncbi:MAG: NADH-quinone oxidoreductase subunit L, partial [Pseudomonadota bacterium]
MEPCVVLLPLFGALFAMPLARLGGARAAEIATTALVGIACVQSWLLFKDVAVDGHARIISLFTWFQSGNFYADWAVRLDTLSAVMLVVVNTVSFLVHAYSIGYMHEDEGRPRFFAYLSLFTFAMLSLVTADNFMQLFFGWEGVGLASYLLIGFWFKKKSANDAAIKAFVVNRVGDFGFALGIFCVFYVFGTVRFEEVFGAVAANATVIPYGQTVGAPIRELTITFLSWEFHALTAMSILLFIGAMGKSAQFLLHTWLPDAMEGPTPVSALIHAATMVTAGVFLVCRCSVLFEYAPDAAALVTLVGATTAFFAATVGLLQDDIKKIVAYSTCSQLGYMFLAAGVGAYGAAMFHLFTHAFFKALLFLGSGAVIHGLHHEQDIKKMGGVRALLPLTHLLMVIGTIAITGVGVPGLKIDGAPLGTAGFVSKDMILESAFAAGEAGKAFGYYGFALGVLAAVMTAFYSWRLIFLTFWGPSRLPEKVKKHPHDVPNVMLWPLAPLAIGALFAGMAFYSDFVGENADKFWNGAIYSAADHASATEAAAHEEASVAAATEAGESAHGEHEFPVWVIWAPFLAMAAGTLGAVFQYLRGDPLRAGLLRPGGMIY